MLMHHYYDIHLPYHDRTVALRHQLTPSVKKTYPLFEGGYLSSSSPTCVVARSDQHDQSNAVDFDRVNFNKFEKVACS